MNKSESEIWKSHPEYTGIEVSSFGRVRSVKGHYYANYQNKDGYMRVGIPVDGKQATKLVHRLVAQVFIQNPNNWPEVNHKDNDRANNRVENLEFCTPKYNSQYREKYGISRAEVAGRPVYAVNLTTLEVLRFQSQSEAGRELGVKQQNINAVIKGKRKQTHGYYFVNDDGHAVDVINQNYGGPKRFPIHDIGGIGLKI